MADEQGRLFNEAKVEPVSEEANEAAAITVAAHSRNRPKRGPLPDLLPVREILHDLTQCRATPDLVADSTPSLTSLT